MQITGWINDPPTDNDAALAAYKASAAYIVSRDQKVCACQWVRMYTPVCVGGCGCLVLCGVFMVCVLERCAREYECRTPSHPFACHEDDLMFLVKCQVDNLEGTEALDPSWLGDAYAVKVAAKAAAADAVVDAGNSTNSTAAAGDDDATTGAETEAPIVVHLAQKRVTHLAQKAPTAHVVGHVQARGQAPRAAPHAGMFSPLQVSCVCVCVQRWLVDFPNACMLCPSLRLSMRPSMRLSLFVPLCVSMRVYACPLPPLSRSCLSLSISRSLCVRARVRGACWIERS
jgi:hypothetical protein